MKPLTLLFLLLMFGMSILSSFSFHSSQQQTFHQTTGNPKHIPRTKFQAEKSFEYTEVQAQERSYDDVKNFFSQFGEVEVLSFDPLLVLIHNFIAPDFCDQVVKIAQEKGLDKSTVLNKKHDFSGRTSSTVWLKDTDSSNELHELSQKVESLCGKAISHQESVQVLRYEVNQQYTLHTDHIEEFNDLESGGRLATCLIYLNEDFEGGETEFPTLKAKVAPRKGSALFWYNVLLPESDAWSLMPDLRLVHAGLPVTEGVKWACNKWVHPVPMPQK